MDVFDKSMSLLGKYLEETAISERSEIWAKIKKLGISGPSVSEYLGSVQLEIQDFNTSFSHKPYTCDDIIFSDFFGRAFRNITMQDTVCLENQVIVIQYFSSTCLGESTTEECVHALAA